MDDKMQPPEGFFQPVSLDRLLSLIPTQGYGILTFIKRLESVAHHESVGTMKHGPTIIGTYGETQGYASDEYLGQGTHRSISDIFKLERGEIDESQLCMIVIDSEEDLDYLNHIILNPQDAPEKWVNPETGVEIYFGWEYDELDDIPAETTRGFDKFIRDLENQSLDMTLEEYIGEYEERGNLNFSNPDTPIEDDFPMNGNNGYMWDY